MQIFNRVLSLWNKQSNLLLESVFQSLIRSFNIKKGEFKILSPILYSLLYSQNRYIFIKLSWELNDYYFYQQSVLGKVT